MSDLAKQLGVDSPVLDEYEEAFLEWFLNPNEERFKALEKARDKAWASLVELNH